MRCSRALPNGRHPNKYPGAKRQEKFSNKEERFGMAEHVCQCCNGDKYVVCPRCGGDGKIQGETCYYCNGNKMVLCPACRGTGKIPD